LETIKKIITSAPDLVPADFELMFKGSDAVERRGVYYAINDEDHPATKLMQSPNKISRGMAASISLSVNKVRRDQGSML
jgi:hypothetical protein